jgi:hypothetical protein
MVAMEFGNITIFLALLFFLGFGKLILNVINHRRLVRKFPGPKGHSMIWGHAKLLGEVTLSFANILKRRCQRGINTGIIAYCRCIGYANEVRGHGEGD